MKLTDVAFRIQLSGSTAEGNHYTGTGTGAATVNPQLFQFSVTMLNDGTTFAWEEVDDPGTDTSYQRYSQPPPMASATWDKLRLTDDAFMVQQTLDYREPQTAMLVGSDQVAGMPVWHVHTSTTEKPNQAQMEVYVRKDNFLPVRLMLSIVDPVSHTDVTYDFTSINSGRTVKLPPSDQVGGS